MSDKKDPNSATDFPFAGAGGVDSKTKEEQKNDPRFEIINDAIKGSATDIMSAIEKSGIKPDEKILEDFLSGASRNDVLDTFKNKTPEESKSSKKEGDLKKETQPVVSKTNKKSSKKVEKNQSGNDKTKEDLDQQQETQDSGEIEFIRKKNQRGCNRNSK